MLGLTRELLPAIFRPEWHPMHLLREGIDEWFDRLLANVPAEARLGAFWKTTMEETEKEVVFRMELPGFEVEHIDVRVADHTLVVEAKTPEVKEKKEKKEETPYRFFRRAMDLPAGLDLAKVEALYRNGILEIHVPRLTEVPGRRVEVKT